MANREPWTARLRGTLQDTKYPQSSYLMPFTDHCLVRRLGEPSYQDVSDRRGQSLPIPAHPSRAHHIKRLRAIITTNNAFRWSNSMVYHRSRQRHTLLRTLLVRRQLRGSSEGGRRGDGLEVTHRICEHGTGTTTCQSVSESGYDGEYCHCLDDACQRGKKGSSE